MSIARSIVRRLSVLFAAVAVAAGVGVVAFAPAASAALPVCAGYRDVNYYHTSYGKLIKHIPSTAYQSGTLNCSLKDSNSGQGVTVLQEALKYCGGQSGLAADGKFGPKTLKALKAVQAAIGTTADGQYGPNTREAMNRMGYWPTYNNGIQGGSYCTGF